MTPIIVSMIFSAALAAIITRLFFSRERELYLAENADLYDAVQSQAAEIEHQRNIIEQPEGPCVQLAMSGYVPTVMHRGGRG